MTAINFKNQSARKKFAVDRAVRRIGQKAKIRQDYLNGIVSHGDLAARHGISPGFVGRILREALAEMQEESQQMAERDLEITERRILKVFNEATQSFERSRTDAEEVITTIKPERCRPCAGSGIVSEALCEECNGEGYIEVETITKRVKGQAGDPNFLRVQLDCLRELNRIKGLGIKTTIENKGPKHLHIHQAPVVDLTGVPDDLLLKALETIDQMKALPSPIDVESKPITGG